MQKKSQQTGQSLIEILFAIAIFTLGVVTIGYLIFESFSSLSYISDATKARLLAVEGVEVVRTLGESHFDRLVPGKYGLSQSEGAWSLVASADTQGKYTRTITISSIDEDEADLTVVVSWQVGLQTKSVTLETYVTNWLQTGGDNQSLDIDINNVGITASGTELSNIALRNIGDDDIDIMQMQIQWNTDSLLHHITLDGADVFTEASSTPITSGALVDIGDHTIGAHTGYHLIDTIGFDGSISGTNCIVAFILSDGTKKFDAIYNDDL